MAGQWETHPFLFVYPWICFLFLRFAFVLRQVGLAMGAVAGAYVAQNYQVGVYILLFIFYFAIAPVATVATPNRGCNCCTSIIPCAFALLLYPSMATAQFGALLWCLRHSMVVFYMAVAMLSQN